MFSSVGLPHGFCFLWNPELLWLHVLSDGLIALAYFLIPLALLRIVLRRKDIPFNGVFFCFAAFIIACGATHVMEVVTLWHPVYWVSGVLKAVTAAISLATFVILLRITPNILALPGHHDLEAANRQLNSVLESTSAGVYSVDANWKITYMNRNAKSLLDKKGNALGQNFFAAYPDQQPETRSKYREVMETRRPATLESFYEPFALFSSVRLHPGDDGGLTVFFDDISEQKRLQRELDRERALREQRIEALAHMAGGLAHEISNPLGIIHARANDLAEVAQNGEPVAAEVVEIACRSIVRTSDRAIRILRGLRVLAREGATDPMHPTAVGALVEQTVELVQRRFETHGISLETLVPSDLPLVPCREVQISQVLLNLLNNAFDAIDASPESERWVKVKASVHREANADASTLRIEVVDGGPGVAAEHKPHLMEAFFTTKAVGAGMGVGLSLSQAIARDHGGMLELSDSEGHTCFRLTLPLSPEQEKDAAA
jgi:C4-dicarboxylate-specific signal transduction histidine kinase